MIQREDLEGGQRLRETSRNREAMYEPFRALASVASDRGLREFRAEDAVLVFVSLTFSPMTQRQTFMIALGRDLDDPGVREEHVDLVVSQMLHLLIGSV